MKTYNVGDTVRLPSVRPENWKHKGEMDHYLGTIVQITCILGNRFYFEGDGGWSFYLTELEEGALITYEIY